MLGLVPTSSIAGGCAAPFGVATTGGADYFPQDFTVRVTVLPSHGAVVKADGVTPILLGQTITGAELAALKYWPAPAQGGSGIAPLQPESWFVLNVPQNGEPRLIGIQAPEIDVAYVTVSELPVNGTVLLTDGITALVPGQMLSLAELSGLIFAPDADASGKISSLRYRAGGPVETAASGGVVLIVGPDAPSTSIPVASAAQGSNIVTPLALALLLDATLSSSSMTLAASPADGNGAAFANLGGQNGQFASPAASLPDQRSAPSSYAEAAAQRLITGTASPVEALTVVSDAPAPGAVGSSTPPVAATSASTTVLQGGTTSTVVLSAPSVGSTSPSGVTVDTSTGSGTTVPNASTSLVAPQVSSLQSAPQSFAATTFSADALTANVVNSNAIVLENQKAGTPQSVWEVDPGEDSTEILGFTTQISTNVGGTVNFKIDNLTGVANYQINIYRLGYYGGDGATLAATIQHQATSAVVQSAPIVNPATGEVDAGNWSVTDSWAVPTNATSGVYVANIVEGTQIFQIPFVIKDPNSTSDILFQTDDETWQAYNGWGGANLYGGNGPSNPPGDGSGEAVPGAAFAVSYNRPIVTRDGIGQFSGPQDSLFGAEYAAIYWMEQNGYDVSYIAGLDTATDGSLLLNHKIFMDAGHDEYWTDSQVANVTAARNAGVNLVFLSGNEIFWQTQLAPSIDGSGTANRTLVSYKDSHFETLINPTGQGTGTFEAPVSWGGAATPSNGLTGTVFSVDQAPTNGTITIPFDMTQLRFWRNTGVATTPSGQTASLEQGLLGYEWDSSPDNGFMPAGLIDLSSTTLQEPTVNTEFGNDDVTGTATHNLVEYRDPTSGALVFGAGTVFWSWGLSDQHDPGPGTDQTNTDPNIQQAMVNVFADMGVQPQTLQASLIIASASSDHTAPTSKITNVSTTNATEGAMVTVTGTASDVGGVIGGVQISTDGGKTWHTTSGQIGTQNVNWTYQFNAPAPGAYVIETRAVDDSLNLEAPGPGTSYISSPSSALTLFGPSATPATANVDDPNAVEVGLKFTSTTNGEITGIRFYKGSSNTGTHLVDLWSSTGTLLATATSTNETASGWQQANFSAPVNITAGTTYVASYHMSGGEYSDTPFYFDTLQATTNGSLTATGNGLNGVFAYSSGSIFPTNSAPQGDNYWVDVVFSGSSGGGTDNPPVAVNDSGFNATENTALSIPAAALLANDSDPDGDALTITGVSGSANGTASFNAQTNTVTFTPTTGYTGPASFTYAISDGRGGTASASVSLSVNAPSSTASLFTVSNTPAQTNLNDGSPIEVGVKFTSSSAGQITALKFYRSPGDTGSDLVDLWSSTGTKLASATFTNTGASGWQTVTLAAPVTISAGTTYVASYHTNGVYVATGNFFTSAVSTGNLTAPSSASSGGNGVYSYGGTSSAGIFPTNTFSAANYFADVVFTGSSGGGTDNPPVAVNDSGFNATENTALSIPASALLANDSDPDGDPLTVTGVSGGVNGSASFNAQTNTVTFTPTTGYTGPASFTYAISDGRGGTASASVSLSVNAPSSTASLFTVSNTPAQTNLNDGSPIEVGVKFTSSSAGQITALKFYRSPGDTGSDLVDLWSSTGTKLASATFTNTGASGWQTVTLAAPVTISAGTTYVASYHTNGVYVATDNFFTSAVSTGNLTAPSSASSGGNGVYSYGGTSSAGIFPTNTFSAANYFADVVFTGSSGGGTDNPPVAVNDSGFNATENTALSIPASALLANDSDPDGDPLTVTGVSGGVNGSASFNAQTNTVTFTPTTGYTGPASFTYAISDGRGGTASASVSLSVNAPSSTVSLFSSNPTPSIVTVNDPSPVELGLKFQASSPGDITGLRFYKGPSNTGTHVADLWSSTGTLLATTTFTNETASGWQQVNFTTPVTINAGTTYIASYHTAGNYSADPNLFANSVSNGPLTAPSSASSGGNGVYAYGGGGLFPTNTFNSTSYGVDVVFRAQLAA